MSKLLEISCTGHMLLFFFRMIQQAFIDMENMFELLDVDQEVCHTNTKV